MLFQGQKLDAELIDALEFERNHACGLGRQVGQRLGNVGAAPDAEDVCDAVRVQSVTVNGRMDAVLERGAQIAQPQSVDRECLSTRPEQPRGSSEPDRSL